MEQLKKRLAKGETEAFVDLYDLLGKRLLGYLTVRLGPHDSRDVLQEIFVRMVRYHRQFGKSTNLEAYVFLVARNEANRWLRKNQRMSSTRATEIPFSLPDGQQSVETSLEQIEFAERLLAQLDSESREIVELKIYSQLTFAEVGRILKRPDATVATKYRRAISKLQSEVSETTADMPSRATSTTKLPTPGVFRGD